MEGPRQPGYYGSVTGIRPVPDGPGRGPTHLIAQVHRYGRLRVLGNLRMLVGLSAQDVELVWSSDPIPVPNDTGDPAWQTAMRICEKQARAQEQRFERLDPDFKGGIR